MAALAQVKARHGVFENAHTGNNTFTTALPIAVTAALTPDLIPAGPAMPAQVDAGQTLGVAISVSNSGAAGALGTWQDAVYISAWLRRSST